MGKGRLKKIWLANMLALLAALAFGFVCFLGMYFYDLGDNTPLNILRAALITLLLSVFAIGAGAFKRAGNNFAINLIWEIIFVLVFTGVMALLALSSRSPFPHYFSVSKQKTKILETINMPVYDVFVEYNKYVEKRKQTYRDTLRKRYKSEKSRKDSNSTTKIDDHIDNEMMVFDKKVALEYKKIDTVWLERARDSIKKWDIPLLPIVTVDIVNSVKQNTGDWLDSLVKISKWRSSNEEAKDFDYKPSFSDVENCFKKPSEPMPVSIAAAILLYVLMLTPYLSSKRSEKPKVLKKTKRNMKHTRDTRININD